MNADGTEEERPITIGDSDAANTIVLGGLVEGETVLVVGSVVTVTVQPAEQQGGFGGFGGQGGQGGQGGFGGQGQGGGNPGGAN